MYQAFATQEEITHIENRYAQGIGWGEMKGILSDKINDELALAREKYEALLEQPELIEEKLQSGAAKARAISQPFIAKLKAAVGIKRFV
jgi:tryptophanyl-tRNA synthetase